jgi:hypothetical protein
MVRIQRNIVTPARRRNKSEKRRYISFPQCANFLASATLWGRAIGAGFSSIRMVSEISCGVRLMVGLIFQRYLNFYSDGVVG